jgi:hypothetical protein
MVAAEDRVVAAEEMVVAAADRVVVAEDRVAAAEDRVVAEEDMLVVGAEAEGMPAQPVTLAAAMVEQGPDRLTVPTIIMRERATHQATEPTGLFHRPSMESLGGRLRRRCGPKPFTPIAMRPG